MTGCIPLAESDILKVADSLSLRDRALLFLGVTTGFRITELLSLTVADVWDGNAVRASVSVARRNTKTKSEGRTKAIVEPAIAAIRQYMLSRTNSKPHHALFASRKGIGKPISRVQAWQVINDSAEKAGLTGKIGTHTMRKTYAKKVYESTNGDYMKAKYALGHRSVASTESYLQFIQETQLDEQIRWSF